MIGVHSSAETEVERCRWGMAARAERACRETRAASSCRQSQSGFPPPWWISLAADPRRQRPTRPRSTLDCGGFIGSLPPKPSRRASSGCGTCRPARWFARARAPVHRRPVPDCAVPPALGPRSRWDTPLASSAKLTSRRQCSPFSMALRWLRIAWSSSLSLSWIAPKLVA